MNLSIRRVRMGHVVQGIAAVGAIAIVLLGLGHQDRGERAERQARAAQRHSAAALAAARAANRRAEADLSAARSAVSQFSAGADQATAASAAVVEAEAALTDRLARLRAAGAAADVGGYNRIVDELNATSGDINRAVDALDVPFRAFAKALAGLPTARCTGEVARTAKWVDYGASGWRCARIAVPLDHAAAKSPSIALTIVMRPADDPQNSKGPLIINPGGPGASGIAALRVASLGFPRELLSQFDIIGFDPRGVGQSAPVDCADDLDPLFSADFTAHRPAVRLAALRRAERLIDGCAARNGDLLNHVDTASTVEALDRIRAALGVENFSYLGFSYGTDVGARYAAEFPNHLRAAVLDAAVDPTRTSGTVDVGSTDDDLSGALDDALADCAVNLACPFRSDDPSTAYDELMDRLRDTPLQVGDQTLGRGVAELGVIAFLYDGADGWPDLMSALARAALGDGAALQESADGYRGRRADGSYDNELEAHAAIRCTDGGRWPSRKALRDQVRDFDLTARFSATDLMLSLPCVYWPAERHHAPKQFSAPSRIPPILVVNSTGDPVTPIDGAEALADALPGSFLLTWDGAGHTAVGRGIDCIDLAVVRYLVDLTLPAAGTTCPGG